jgi:hypothetical protein
MSGYVASGRIVRAAPRLARPAHGVDRVDDAFVTERDLELIVEPNVASDGGAILADRRAAFRERWAQLTFFLLDANSWR